MSTAPKYLPHYTVTDYQLWKGDWELWQGVPVAMTPSPFGPHGAVAPKLVSTLVPAVESSNCDAVVLQEIDWIISDDTVVRPDITLVCGDVPEGHVTQPPALIVEILSQSTAERDRNEKLELYEENGVRYYLIVDPNEKTIEAFRRNEVGNFESFDPAGEQDYAVCGDCRIRWDVTSSF